MKPESTIKIVLEDIVKELKLVKLLHLEIIGHSEGSTKLFDGHKRYGDGWQPLTGRYFKCCIIAEKLLKQSSQKHIGHTIIQRQQSYFF